MKREVYPGESFVGVVLCMISFMFGTILAAISTKKMVRNEATKNGAAEYIANPKTGETTFVWLECDCND